MSETIQEVTGKTAGEYFVRLDALVRENLGNLEGDMRMWGAKS